MSESARDTPAVQPQPYYRLIISVSEQPRVPEGDAAIRTRLVIIPFQSAFQAESDEVKDQD